MRLIFNVLISFCFFGPLGLQAEEPQRRVLIVGDSHVVGAFGENLARLFEGEGAQVLRRGVGGSNPTRWTGGQLPGLYRQHRPNLLVFEFGDNLTDYRSSVYSPSVVEREVQALLATIPDDVPPGRCFFVTPTFGEPGPVRGSDFGKTTRRLRQVITTISRTLAASGNRCQMIDSTRLATLTERGAGQRSTTVTTVDSLHLDEPSGRRWAQAVHQRIRGDLSRSTPATAKEPEATPTPPESGQSPASLPASSPAR